MGAYADCIDCRGGKYSCVYCDARELDERIALAIAELEKAKPGLLLTGVASWHVDRALALLKGEQ